MGYLGEFYLSLYNQSESCVHGLGTFSVDMITSHIHGEGRVQKCGVASFGLTGTFLLACMGWFADEFEFTIPLSDKVDNVPECIISLFVYLII